MAAAVNVAVVPFTAVVLEGLVCNRGGVVEPDSVRVPGPKTVNVPVVAGIAPDTVRVVVLVVTAMAEAVPALIVNARLVEAEVPVYCSVPPPRTRFAAAFVAAPRFPVAPPLPIVATLSTPALIVVTPV